MSGKDWEWEFEKPTDAGSTGAETEENKKPPLSSVRESSEKLSMSSPDLTVSFPFDLQILGTLSVPERQILSERISAEEIGIHSRDLDPAFDKGDIRIPRISEWSARSIARPFKNLKHLKVSITPSESPFDGDDIPFALDSLPETAKTYTHPSSIPAQKIPLLAPKAPANEIPDSYEVLDTLTASATLEAHFVENPQSFEYQELLEGLKLELKSKALRRGATHIINFDMQLSPVAYRQRYRLHLMGKAIREKK